MAKSFLTSGIITFGCRLNSCESEIIHEFIKKYDLKNYIIINTCAVTAEAERKLCQTIRKLYSDNPSIQIILTGCASELKPDFYIKMSGVVGIVSNKLKLFKEEYLKYLKIAESNSTIPDENVVSDEQKIKKIRGFLQIQNGCDQKCTYCIIRMTRGSNISLDKDKIVTQAHNLLNKGYKEIVLTGVNISAYGKDRYDNVNLAYIIKYLLKHVPQLKRLRLSSLDPADIDLELIKLIAGEERLLPHIHESIQSGDNIVLKRMMRRHSREQVIDINSRILQLRSDVVFGADIIVGFPTETEEMFMNTKKLITDAHISLLHSFPFSARPGTPAVGMPMVNRGTIIQRAKELRATSKIILSKKLSEYVGRRVIAIAETKTIARTNTFLQIKSLTSLEVGMEYIFYCSNHDKKYIIGNPISGVL